MSHILVIVGAGSCIETSSEIRVIATISDVRRRFDSHQQPRRHWTAGCRRLAVTGLVLRHSTPAQPDEHRPVMRLRLASTVRSKYASSFDQNADSAPKYARLGSPSSPRPIASIFDELVGRMVPCRRVPV